MNCSGFTEEKAKEAITLLYRLYAEQVKEETGVELDIKVTFQKKEVAC